MRRWIDISREQRVAVHQTVSDGSNPRPTFFVFVALSTLIAAFGLIMDSGAVVIGAMLVAPLMTPILGIALALVQGNSRLLGHALRSEIAGAVVAITVATAVGVILPYYESTGQMLSRTAPNLLDLFVAVFAGIAGAYALVDEKVSPALPGVAISTAIVPPLANSGLCIALGAYNGAWGSFLLFFTNFLCILLVSAAVFGLAGMARQGDNVQVTVARRFGLLVVGTLVVGFFLARELGQMMEERRLLHSVRTVLARQLVRYRVSDLERLVQKRDRDGVKIMAHLHAPRVLSPHQVKNLERELEGALDSPVELLVRTTLSADVSSSGTRNQAVRESLDGFFFVGGDAESKSLQIAEQAIREYLGSKLGQGLVRLDSFEWNGSPAIIAAIHGVRRLRPSEVAELEELVRGRVGNPNIRLGVHQDASMVVDREGPVHFEFAMRRGRTPEEESLRTRVSERVRGLLAESEFKLIDDEMTCLDGVYYFLFEVSGTSQLTTTRLREIEREVDDAEPESVELIVRVVRERVVSGEGYHTWDEIMTEFARRNRAAYESETLEFIQNWR